MKNCIIIIIALIVAVEGFAQQDSTKSTKPKAATGSSNLHKQGNKLIRKGHFGAALPVWQEVYAQYPDNANVNFKLGLCYHFLPGNQKMSLTHFKKSIESTTKQHRFNSKKETDAPLDAIYFLGAAYLALNNMDSALHYFVRYEDAYDGEPPLDVGRQISKCANAISMMKKPRMLKISNAGSLVNTEDFYETAPVISLNRQLMFFSSRRLRKDNSNREQIDGVTGQHFEDIYIATRDSPDENWNSLTYFNGNTDKNEKPLCLSADMKTLYFSREDNKSVNLYITTLTGTSWSEPELLASGISKKRSNETGLAVTPDDQYLFFISDRAGGYGKNDIYYCLKDGNGKWSKPRNMGKTINSKFNEVSPSVHPNGKTLYFSSSGHSDKSMGGYDIYSIDISGEKGFSAPVNIGYPINTTRDDLDFYVSSEGARYYASLRRDRGFDIYEVGPGEFIDEDGLVGEEGIASAGDIEVMEVENEVVEILEVEQEVIEIEEVERRIGEIDVSQIDDVDDLMGIEEVVEVEEIENRIGEIDVSQLDDVDQVIGLEEVVEIVEVEVEKKADGKEGADDYAEATWTGGLTYQGSEDEPDKKASQDMASAEASIAEDLTTPSFHRVKPGQTLYSIAQDYNIPVSELKEINQLKTDELSVGQALALNVDSKGVDAIDIESTNPYYHRVKPGQTLYSIAREYGMSVDELMDINNLGSSAIYVGQALILNDEAEDVKIEDEPVATLEELQKLDLATLAPAERQEIILKVKTYLAEEMEAGSPTIFKSLYFDFNSRNLSFLSQTELDILIGFLNENPSVNIEILGHTDNTGDWDDNFWISRERAYTVYDYLINKGVSKKRMIFNGKGSISPIASNENRKGRKMNRRVEIILLNM